MPYKIRPQKQKEEAQIQVVSRGQALMESLSEKPQVIWGGIALLVVVAVVTFFMQSARNNAEEAAWTIEAEASKLLHDPPPLPKPIEEGDEDAPLEIMNETQRIEKSLERYAEILAKHGDTNAARIALFESANAYAKLQKDEQAVEKYTAFIAKYPDSKKLVVLSHLRLAYLEQKKGDEAAAIDRFRMLYEMPASDNKDQAGFELARALEISGKDDEAKALYQKLSEDYVETPWGTEAKARSLLLSPPPVASTEEKSATETPPETPQSDSTDTEE